ncbi:MAG: PrsW family glutamic-type intramembrane protease [Candidatus Zambryskibacteria bacterium]|nr:PrsW family glutamic-type intramembrane protease [Candidatus Zambryskibacteria bacterium]
MINFETILYSLLGGILPALLWLWFWLHEDKKHPEPRSLVAKTFLLGMLSVLLVLPFQKGIEILLPGMILPAIFLWALFEEVFKLGAGYFGGLHSREDNEPMDPIIYMITAALGFVALENTLFLLGPIIGADFVGSFVTGNLRFVGASLLHVVSSGFIGVALAFTFYKPKEVRRKWLLSALVTAIVFHTGFNMSILKLDGIGTIISFLGVWLGVIFIIWAFERTKLIAPRRL